MISLSFCYSSLRWPSSASIYYPICIECIDRRCQGNPTNIGNEGEVEVLIDKTASSFDQGDSTCDESGEGLEMSPQSVILDGAGLNGGGQISPNDAACPFLPEF